jgi:hypothetical protein
LRDREIERKEIFLKRKGVSIMRNVITVAIVTIAALGLTGCSTELVETTTSAPRPIESSVTEAPEPGEYGSDADLDQLYERCDAGDAGACDTLYWDSPIDSGYEAFAVANGGGGMDGIDEYDTVDLLTAYDVALETLVPEMIEGMFTPLMCEAFALDEDVFWDGFFDPSQGFYSTAPDELQYVLSEDEVRNDVRPIITAHCATQGM